MELKEIQIGKIVKYKGVRLVAVKAIQGCRGCFFKKMTSCETEKVGVCCRPWRAEDIIFRKYDTNKILNQHEREWKKKSANHR